MKKLVCKTAILTFIIIVAVGCVLYGAVASFAPKSLASAWGELGCYGLSVKYYVKRYEQTADISDLATVCDNVDEKTDASRAEEYLSAFTSREEFASYCYGQDNKGGATAYEFYYGKYAVATYYKNGLDAALSVAERSVSNGYTQRNAFYTLMVSVDGLTSSDGSAIASKIGQIKDGFDDSVQTGYAEQDILLARFIK